MNKKNIIHFIFFLVILVADAYGADTLTGGTPFEFNGTIGKYPALAQVDSTHYLVVYEGPVTDGWSAVLDTGTNPITIEDTHEFAGTDGTTPALYKIDSDDYLCVYAGKHDDGYAVMITVDPSTYVISSDTAAIEYDGSNGMNPAIAQIDATHYLVVYTGDGSEGWSTVLEVNTTTKAVTEVAGSSYQFEATGVEPDVSKIDDEHYLIAYQGTDTDAKAAILIVNTSTYATSGGSALTFNATSGISPSIAKIDATHFLVAYTGPSEVGDAVILTVNTTTDTVTNGSTYEFDASSGLYPDLAGVDSTNYLLTYANSSSSKGIAAILTVDVGADSISKGTTYDFEASNTGLYSDLVAIDATHYLLAYTLGGGGGDDGWAQILDVGIGAGISYESSGSYTSTVFDAGLSVNWDKLNWHEVTDDDTLVKFQVRSCDDALCDGETFVGDDGTSGSYFTDYDGADGTGNDSVVSDNRYFQYKAYLETSDTDKTPELSSVTIGYIASVGGGGLTGPYIYKWEEIF